MAIIYASPVQNLMAGIAGALKLGDASLIGGKVHVTVKSVDLAAQAQIVAADWIEWCELPKGAVPIVGILDASVTLGSSTIDVGTNLTPAKFRAAATFTAVDTPTLVMKAAAMGVPLAAKTRVRSIVAAASLPTSGIVTFAIAFTTPHSG